MCSYIDKENHYWYNNNVINTDYKLDKRIDGIEADWVYSRFWINYIWELKEKGELLWKTYSK